MTNAATMSSLFTNQFRAVDAFEYTNVYRSAVQQTPAEIRDRLNGMADRMERQPQAASTLWLAGYRALEDALLFVEKRELPDIVKLADNVRDVAWSEV